MVVLQSREKDSNSCLNVINPGSQSATYIEFMETCWNITVMLFSSQIHARLFQEEEKFNCFICQGLRS